MWSTISTILFLFQGCCLVVTTERHTIGLAEVYTTLCATHRLSHKILKMVGQVRFELTRCPAPKAGGEPSTPFAR